MDLLSKIVGAIRGLKSDFIDKPIQSGQNAIQNWAQNNPGQARAALTWEPLANAIIHPIQQAQTSLRQQNITNPIQFANRVIQGTGQETYNAAKPLAIPYAKNRIIQPATTAFQNYISSGQPGISGFERAKRLGMAGLGALQTAVNVSPAGPVWAAYDALKGGSYIKTRGGNDLAQWQGAAKGFTGEKTVGLGTAMTTNKYLEPTLNIAEIAVPLAMGGWAAWKKLEPIINPTKTPAWEAAVNNLKSNFGFTTEDITNQKIFAAKFRQFALNYHPDRGGDQGLFSSFMDSYNTIVKAGFKNPEVLWSSVKTAPINNEPYTPSTAPIVPFGQTPNPVVPAVVNPLAKAVVPPPVAPAASALIPPEPVVPQSASKMQVGITSAQPANPSVADILKEGNAYFEKGNIDAGLAKLHEVTLSTKPEIQQLLSSDGVSTINNLDTNTHGLYFGNPEPSFWLNLDTTDVNKTAASVAQFAKNHKQDSFITATPSVNPNASLGFKMSIGQPLPNQDILTIEKVFNDNGIGLTLNQKTGEGYAMNIKEFDGMTPEQFHTAYIKTRLALSQLGINAKFILDKYDVKVYNNSTYDKLISAAKNSGSISAGGQPATPTGGAIDRGAINEARLNAGNIPPQISQKEVIPPSSVYTGQQKESQFINTLKENQTIPTDLTSGLSSKYDITSDQGRKDYGLAAAQTDLTSAYKRVISGLGDANELNGLTYGVTKVLQAKAHEARLAGNTEMYRAYQNQFEQAAIAYQKRVSPAAQTVQFSHVFKYTTPDGIIDMVKDIFTDANDIRNLSVGRVVRAISGKPWKVEFTPAKEQYIRDQMKDIVLLPDAERIQATKSLINEVTKDIPIPVMSLIDAYRYQNALSGWRTHMKNVVSNVFNSSIVKPVRLLDMAAWDLLKSTIMGKPRTNSFREIPIYYRGLFGSVKEATNVFMDTFQNGTALGKSDIPVDEFRTSLSQIMMARTPKILTVAGRALEAADQFFVTLTSNAEYLRLKSKGVDESVARKMALDFSKYILYKNPLDLQNTTSQGLMMTKIDQFTNWLMKMRNTVPPPLNWFVMFLRVPMDVAKMSASYHPLTSVATLAGMSDPTKVAEQWSNVRVGAAIALLGAAAAVAGKTTWIAPTDAKLKSAFYDTGRKPFSFAVDTPTGRVWVPFAYLGPWALSYGMGAAYQHYFADSKTAMTDSTAQKVGSLLISSLNQWSQSTPVAGLGGFVRTIQGDIDYNTINNLSFTAGQMVLLNSLMGNIAAVVDPTFRRPKGFIQGLQKNIPWASTGLEPITDSLGQPAQRNLSDYVLPYTLGQQNNVFEQPYQDAKLLQQQSSEANFYQKMADSAGGTVAGTTSGGAGGTKVLSTQKGNLDKLYETYDTITDPATRDKIKKSITDRGVNFDTGYENYLMKDTKVKQQGLSPAAQATLQRSNEYAFIRVLRNKYDGTGIGGDTLAAEMKKKNISQADLEYDDKTKLPDDIQLEEIKAGITGLSYDDMLTKLVSYRKVSEGTRKPLLTNELISTLNKDGLIDKSTAAWLKSTVWDAKTQSFTKATTSGGSAKKFPKITFPKPTAYKFKAPQVSGAKLTPVKLPPSYKSTIRKAKASKTGQFKRSALKLPSIPAPTKTLSGLTRLHV